MLDGLNVYFLLDNLVGVEEIIGSRSKDIVCQCDLRNIWSELISIFFALAWNSSFPV